MKVKSREKITPIEYRQVKSLRIISVSGEDFGQMDCLFVAILSHGDDKRVFGTDEPVSYDCLFEPLREPRNISLIGKPKVILIQVSNWLSLHVVALVTGRVGIC